MFEAKQPAQTRAVYGNHITAWDKRIHFVHSSQDNFSAPIGDNSRPASASIGAHSVTKRAQVPGTLSVAHQVVMVKKGQGGHVGGRPFGVKPMTNWTYASGRLEARNQAGALLLVIQAAPMWAPLADLFNANQRLSRLLLAG